MIKKNNRIIVFVIMFLAVACTCDAYAVENKKNEILSSWLSSHNEYRFADISDCEDGIKKEDIERFGVHCEPYLIEGNFDGDRESDFAVIVVNKADKKDFLILVFMSIFERGQRPLVYGNIFGGTLSGMVLIKNDFNKKKSILLFGAIGSEAEPIHLPIQLP